MSLTSKLVRPSLRSSGECPRVVGDIVAEGGRCVCHVRIVAPKSKEGLNGHRSFPQEKAVPFGKLRQALH